MFGESEIASLGIVSGCFPIRRLGLEDIQYSAVYKIDHVQYPLFIHTNKRLHSPLPGTVQCICMS